MSNLAWLYVALATVAVAIGGYIGLLLTRKKALKERLQALRSPEH